MLLMFALRGRGWDNIYELCEARLMFVAQARGLDKIYKLCETRLVSDHLTF